jgi:hypothetical protein
MDSFTEQRGLQTVTAEVIAYGPAQNFSRTVTIDRGTADGVQADMTVLNTDGLVGRVVRADTARRPSCWRWTPARWSAAGSVPTRSSASCAATATCPTTAGSR